MNYIIFDLEWNQGAPEEAGRVETLPFEIVEIGAVKLNDSREMISEFSELVKPQVYTQMNYITTRLVHLKMSQLENGKPFKEVREAFLEWCGEDYVFCTWGNLDLLELQRNMVYYGMEPLSDEPIPFYDIQKMFSLAYEDGKSRRALEYAIDMMGIKKDIPFHRAFSDAYYTAKVFDMIEEPEVLEKVSFDTYSIPTSREKEVHITFSNYNKYISRGFKQKSDLLKCKDVTGLRCYKCNRPLKRKLQWYTPNGKHYYAVGSCFRHGLMKSKLRIRRNDSLVYGVRTDKFISKEDMKLIIERKEKAEEAKRNKKNILEE